MLRAATTPDEVVAAAVLHDVIEDTGVSRDELEERFGPRVAALVSAVTEPSADGSYHDRKARLRDAVAGAEPDALAIYAADKVGKLRELRMTIATTPAYTPDEEQLDHYRRSLAHARAPPSRRSVGAPAPLRARDAGHVPARAGLAAGCGRCRNDA